MTQQCSLRERLMVRNGYKHVAAEELTIPETGRIDEATESRVQELAIRALGGDKPARDTLYTSFRLRLNHLGYILMPWPNSADMTGIWDRGDIRQESWFIFNEMLMAWDGESRFVTHLLGRFRFRLRDRILRGIGRPQTQLGKARVAETLLADLLKGDESEQPESAVLANELLANLVRMYMSNDESADSLERWVEIVSSNDERPLVTPGRFRESGKPGSRDEAA